LLFAAYPVFFLWSQNLGETKPIDVIAPLVLVVVAAGLLTLILGRLLGDRRRGALIVTPLAVGLLMYGHVGSYVSDFGFGALYQQAGWVTLVGLAVVGAVRLSSRWIATLDLALLRIGAILVTVTLLLILPFQASAATGGDGRTGIAQPRPDTTTAPKRDVYWFIFDRYGSDRSLEMLYGIQNDLTPWLREQGFEVLEDSHANYVRTALSVPTTMNVAHLADLPGLPGPDSSDLGPVQDLLQGSLVARQFKELGYRYIHVGSWWGPTKRDSAADLNLSIDGLSEFQATLLDSSAGPALLRRLGVRADDRRKRYYHANEYGLDALVGLRDEPGPKFVFGHVLLPHPPTMYDSDGSFMTTEDQRDLSGTERATRQLAYTNTRIREIIGGLLALPEAERPIIILQADEGPESSRYRTSRSSTFDWAAASDDEVEEKYGILNAWYLPGGEDLELDPAMTSINTFPVLFRRYFGLDYDLLPDRIFTSKRYILPYDLTEVTDRLPSLRK
jgi:hypothetical protein